jgi:hypothetical protein
MKRQPTTCAVVSAGGKVFADHGRATAALLTGAPGIHLHKLDTGTLSLVSQDIQEAGPAGVTDCQGQPAVPQHPANVEAFGSDKAVSKDQSTGDLIMMFAPQIPHAGVDALEPLDGLAAVAAALLPPAYSPRRFPKLRKSFLQISGIGFVGAFAGSEEVFEPNVDADGLIAAGFYLGVSQVAGKDQEPLASFAFERGCLDRPLMRAVQLDSYRADMLDAKAIVNQLDAIPVGWEFNAVVAVSGLKAGIARFAAALLDSAEEVGEGFVQASHRGLGTGEVEAGKVGVNAPLALEPGRLFGVLDRTLLPLVGTLTLV